MRDFLIKEITNDKWMMTLLYSVKDLKLNDCWIGAGFIRNKAWDLLHHYSDRTPLTDIDVIYFDSNNTDQKSEESIKSRLLNQHADINWEVINQARTHIWHNREPYHSTYEAISDWVETATCVAARIDSFDRLEIIAPHGLEDLENLVLRPVPSLTDLSIFHKRVEAKNWLEKWPKLSLFKELS